MNNFFYKSIVFISMLAFGFTLSSLNGCNRENHQTAKFVSITYGGCNSQSEVRESQRSVTDAENDTVIFDYQNGTLKVNVGINYICCSSFEATQGIDGNNISLLITETTPSPEQYCRCECYYTFNYCFTDLSQKSYIINVVFDAKDDDKDKNFSKFFNF